MPAAEMPEDADHPLREGGLGVRDRDAALDARGHLLLAPADGVEDLVAAVQPVLGHEQVDELLEDLGLVLRLEACT